MTADPYRYFRIEARELVDEIGKGTLDLERGERVGEVVARLLRFAHTLKGAARVVRQREIADAAHSIEDALARHRDSQQSVPRDTVDAILRLVDDMNARVVTLGAAAQPTDGPGKPEEPPRSLRADIADVDALVEGLGETHAQLGALRRSLGEVEHAHRLTELLDAQLAAPAASVAMRLDRTRALGDELRRVISRLDWTLSHGVEQIDRELRQVGETAERLHLVPASVVLSALERVSRDVARAQGKVVVFESHGGDVRLASHVLVAVQNALVQIVRNAIVHGIETEPERRASDKPPRGRLVVELQRRAGRIVFRCTDDGRGIDLEAVRRAAHARGDAAAEIDGLGSSELLDLLLRGGISTSGTVTELSGRGVGLDVVREAAQRVGGSVHLETRSGRGTTFELLAPMSIAALTALVVESGTTRATIPLDAVRCGVRVAPTHISRTPEGASILFEDTMIPFMPLTRALSPRSSITRGRGWSAVVVRGAGGVAALGVDRLLGTASIVLRPLPPLAPASAVISGVSLDVNGVPTLALDPDGIVNAARRTGSDETESVRPRLPVLVIDDSVTTRMLEQSILESAGYAVDSASSGEEALEKAGHRRYALFLVDIEMPGMDGFTFIERTRADPALRDVPSILVSSRASPDDMRRGREVGAHGYVVKSEFDQAGLLERIRELVG